MRLEFNNQIFFLEIDNKNKSSTIQNLTYIYFCMKNDQILSLRFILNLNGLLIKICFNKVKCQKSLIKILCSMKLNFVTVLIQNFLIKSIIQQ